ncbi:HNH endonuclease [Paracoccus suum]|uniref:HNH endonuclease n=1 Tax=Paracoccus suum TaxID=2259340 RepID=A0A344PLX7_9RHOB|nr:HNH endonuclease signature motif containing protein [Paracoccus suum]AXC50382.1 HNH endonuclease [Paracoccus suum]
MARRDPLPRTQRILQLSAWRRDVRALVALRAAFRCEHCHGFTGMDGECDHIVSRRKLAETGGSPWDTANLQWLCPGCHSRKTAAERRAARPQRPRSTLHARAPIAGREAFLAAAGFPAPDQPPSPAPVIVI